MIIFKYNLKKYFRTVSTWILLFLGIGLVGLFSLIFTNTWPVNSTNHNLFWEDSNKKAIFNTYLLLTPILVVIISLFAAFKSVQLFRDEINEGSLLLVISKPISRKRILMQKWFALITIFGIFILPILATQTTIMLIFIKYRAAHHLIWLGLMGEFFVLIVFFLLISSLALMLSLRLGVKSVLGLSFACTILVVISNSVQMFTYHNQFTIVNSKKGKFGFGGLGTISQQWNLTNNSVNNVPKIYVKTSKKKPLFNKLWPFSLDYQISQMSSMFLNEKSVNNNDGYTNGYKRMMKVKSTQEVNFTKYANSFFLDQKSTKFSTYVTNYLNNNNYNGVKISDYLAPALEDAQIYLTNKIKSFTPAKPNDIRNNTLELTFNDFETYNGGAFKNSAAKFMSVISNSNLARFIWNFKFSDGSGGDDYNPFPSHDQHPDKNSPKTNAENANSFFNWILNYHMSKTNAQSFLDKGIGNIVFQKDKYHDKGISNIIDFYIDDLDNGQINGYSSKHIYNAWDRPINFVWTLMHEYKIVNDLNLNSKIDLNVPLSSFNKYFYQVKFENYANPYVLSFLYLGITIGIVPVTYLLFKRNDFS